jgi:hypothetical protein
MADMEEDSSVVEEVLETVKEVLVAVEEVLVADMVVVEVMVANRIAKICYGHLCLREENHTNIYST